MAVKSKEFKTASDASKYLLALRKLFPDALIHVNQFMGKNGKPAFKIHIA
jgi:hypothetical protein